MPYSSSRQFQPPAITPWAAIRGVKNHVCIRYAPLQLLGSGTHCRCNFAKFPMNLASRKITDTQISHLSFNALVARFFYIFPSRTRHYTCILMH